MTAPDHVTPLRLGILGMSEGNGHPYSWAAIFNGFEPAEMAACPFPSIPSYLAKQRYPDDFLSSARVTQVWTQDQALSKHIAAASRIERVADTPEAMIGSVDAVLLARDDAANHMQYAGPFLDAGIPIYIDKPLAVARRDAEAILTRAGSTAPVFSCSALRYARELQPSPSQLKQCGRIRFVDAIVPGKWNTYAVHVIEPVLAHLVVDDEIAETKAHGFGDLRELVVTWKSGLVTRFSSLGRSASPIGFTIHGENGNLSFALRDSFVAFREALAHFVEVVRGQRPNIPIASTLRVVDLIELGNRS